MKTEKTTNFARLLLAMLATGACGPTVEEQPQVVLPSEEGKLYGRTLCQAMQECGCALPTEPDADCEGEYAHRFDTLLASGLGVSRSCLDTWVDAISNDPCLAGEDLASVFQCSVLRGTTTEGGTCMAHVGLAIGIEECSDGFQCQDAVCKVVPESNEVPWIELDQGMACGPSYTGFCRRDDLYCDASEGVCRERVSMGSTCVDDGCFSCSEANGGTLYCKGAGPTSSGICEVLPRVGERCDPSDIVNCGSCGDVGWCEPASQTCVAGRAPSLCRQVHE